MSIAIGQYLHIFPPSVFVGETQTRVAAFVSYRGLLYCR